MPIYEISFRSYRVIRIQANSLEEAYTKADVLCEVDEAVVLAEEVEGEADEEET